MKNFYKDYWDNNLNNWATQYIISTKKNEENFKTNSIVNFFYKILIYRLEKKATKNRLKIAKSFLEKNKFKNSVLNDVGAGDGFVTKNFLRKFKRINFIDFSKEAIAKLKKIKGSRKKIYHLDIINEKLPISNLSICLGVTPYIEKKYQVKFLNNILDNTNLALIHYLDKDNIFNIIRNIIVSLNVRKVNFYSKKILNNFYKKKNFILKNRIYFGTGFCDIVYKSNK